MLNIQELRTDWHKLLDCHSQDDLSKLLDFYYIKFPTLLNELDEVYKCNIKCTEAIKVSTEKVKLANNTLQECNKLIRIIKRDGIWPIVTGMFLGSMVGEIIFRYMFR